MAKKYQIHGKFGGGSTEDIYVLHEGETIENAPEEAAIVIDPFTEPETAPDSESSGGAKYKFLASAEPITEPVNKIEVSIEEDGITEIILVGKVQQAEANSYSYAYIAINGKGASYNTGVNEKNDCWMHYHGVLLEGGYCLFDMRIDQWGTGNLTHALKNPQSGFDGFGTQVKTVDLCHAAGAEFAVGTYFDVWGR